MFSYVYLVSHVTQMAGHGADRGRCFIVFKRKIRTQAHIEEIEEFVVAAKPGSVRSVVLSYTLMRRVWFGHWRTVTP